jgi:hypothetical protein
MTKRSELLSIYSDMHKDRYGMRPRGDWLRTASEAELSAEIDLLDKWLQEELEGEAIDEALFNNLPVAREGWCYTPAAE